jgi:tyrosyl-tRNA synthetase
MDTIAQQVAFLMQGAEFGDTQIKNRMEAELGLRLTDSYANRRPLRVYCGYDVTAPDIHLGHTITMRKLREFQELGHQIFFVIGTFTTLIGDPSDRDKARPTADFNQILKNAASYAEQAFKILDREKTTVCYNHEWLNQLNFAEVIKLASNFTVQQFLVRDRLRRRIEANEPLGLTELLYPLAQGYDAVHLQADVQLGGSEQLFNLMAGRKLQEIMGQKPQVCLAFPLLPGLDGKIKMSKSLGNYIGLNEPAASQFGKVMSLSDEMILTYFSLVTRWKPDQVAALEIQLKGKLIHPMAAKKLLASEIVSIFHGPEEADRTAAEFSQIHQQHELPERLPEFKMMGPTSLLDILVQSGICSSKSQAKRLIAQNGIKIDGITLTQPDTIIRLSGSQQSILQKGPNTFLRLF